jgi:hypothetical protein
VPSKSCDQITSPFAAFAAVPAVSVGVTPSTTAAAPATRSAAARCFLLVVIVDPPQL